MSQRTVWWIKRTIFRHGPLLVEFIPLTHLCQPQVWHPVWHWVLFLPLCALNMLITLQLPHHNSCNSPSYTSLLSSLLGSWKSLLYDDYKAQFPDFFNACQMLLPTCFHLKINMNISPSPTTVFVSECWSEKKKKKPLLFCKILPGLCPVYLMFYSFLPPSLVCDWSEKPQN